MVQQLDANTLIELSSSKAQGINIILIYARKRNKKRNRKEIEKKKKKTIFILKNKINRLN